nr:RNA helicase GLH-2 [Caenorhabditis elegans]AAB03510.1 GLH-2 [Caenorhabditis elegans]
MSDDWDNNTAAAKTISFGSNPSGFGGGSGFGSGNTGGFGSGNAGGTGFGSSNNGGSGFGGNNNVGPRFGNGNAGGTGFGSGNAGGTGFGSGNAGGTGFGSGNAGGTGFGSGNAGGTGFGSGNAGGTGFGSGNAGGTGLGSGNAGGTGFGSGNAGGTGFGSGNAGGTGFGSGKAGGTGFGSGKAGGTGFGGNSNSGSGFGSGLTNGFGSGNNHESGFGGGKSGGFGGGNSGGSGFGSGGNSNGFGSGGGGQDRGERNNNCFNCQQPGHRSNDCPEPKKEREPRVCYNCQQPGHNSRDCPEERKPREGRNGFTGGSSGFGGGNGGGTGFDSGLTNGFGSGNNGESGFGSGGFGGNSNGFGSGGGGQDRGERNNNCFNCQQPGHRSNDCPEPKKEREPRVCYNCQQPGHNSRDCPEERKPREGRNGFTSGFGGGNDGGFGGGNAEGFGNNEERGPMKCFNCKGEGHRSAECPEPPRGCFNCGEQGHRSNECPNPAKPREGAEGEGPKATYVPVEDNMEEVFNMQKISEGLMFNKFFDAEVKITSDKKPVGVKTCKTFSEANLGETMKKNVAHAGYTKTTPIQQYTLPLIHQGHDIMACAQTGSGKTAAFLLPIMARLIDENDLNTAGEGGCYPRCIILTPTRELTDQIYNEGRKFAYQTMMEIRPVYGGLAVGYNKGQIEKGATIIVGTVGRIKHFCEEGTIKLDKCRFFVLDEADRMIDAMGFGTDIDTIVNYESMPKKENRQTLMFSATFPDSVQEAARNHLKEGYIMLAIDKIGAANKCVLQEFEKCDRSEKKDKLLEILGIDIDSYTTEKNSEVYTKKTIVFVSQRAMADTLASILSSAQVPAITIHGAREQRERSEALRQFRNGSKPVLIATAVAERGLDIKGVDHVINYDMPDNIDDYIHRIGRTGRVGNAGRATSFISEDCNLLSELVRVLSDADQLVPEWMQGASGGNFGASFGFESSVPTQKQDEDCW